MSSSTTEVFNKSGVESTMNKIGGTFQEISSDYVSADQQMISNLTTPDGAMFGAGATKVLNAWDENSGTLEDFMTTFENWAALVSGMANEFTNLEEGTYKVKDGSPYSEEEIAKRARDFHTTALKTEAGITAFNTAQSDYYNNNKDKDYLQSYDNNGIAYTSVRRLENGKIVETKVYKDEQGNYIAEEEHWTWNDKDKKFEHTTEYYYGGKIDDSGQYNHKGLNPITEEDFKKEYNKIKAASEAQTGSGQTGGGTDQVIIDTEEMSATTDDYTLFKKGDKTYIKDPNGDVYLVTNDDGTYAYTEVDSNTLQPTGEKPYSDSQLDQVINGLTNNSDYAKGVVGATEGNTQYSIDKDGNLVVENPFGIGETNDITMEVKYDKNSNQPTEYTLKTKSGATITTLTPQEYKAIMTQKGTATVTENGKTVTFEVDKDKKIITKTTTDNKVVVSTETASIGDDGKVTVSYEYRDAGTEEMHKYSYEIPKDGETKTNIKYDGVNVTDEELQKLMLGTTNNGDGQTTSYSVSSEDGTFIEETKKGEKPVKKVEIKRDSDGTLKKSTTTTYYPSGSQSETNNYYDNGTTIRETVVET
ncbi:MAG: hypothetical protein K6E24_03325, partial [bacterium]|nr:hypothetical protein [bacterium]